MYEKYKDNIPLVGENSPFFTAKALELFEADKIMAELEKTFHSGFDFDVVTIFGEGEPALYLGLGELIHRTKSLTKKPVAE